MLLYIIMIIHVYICKKGVSLSSYICMNYGLIMDYPNVCDELCDLYTGKIIFGRSHVRDVALRRKEPIGEYCKVGQISGVIWVLFRNLLFLPMNSQPPVFSIILLLILKYLWQRYTIFSLCHHAVFFICTCTLSTLCSMWAFFSLEHLAWSLSLIDYYNVNIFQELISLPPKISTSGTVLKFFEPQPEDIDLPSKE